MLVNGDPKLPIESQARKNDVPFGAERLEDKEQLKYMWRTELNDTKPRETVFTTFLNAIVIRPETEQQKCFMTRVSKVFDC